MERNPQLEEQELERRFSESLRKAQESMEAPLKASSQSHQIPAVSLVTNSDPARGSVKLENLNEKLVPLMVVDPSSPDLVMKDSMPELAPAAFISQPNLNPQASMSPNLHVSAPAGPGQVKPRSSGAHFHSKVTCKFDKIHRSGTPFSGWLSSSPPPHI